MAPQSSFQGSRSSTKSRGRKKTCFCGERPVLRTSSTAENLGRRLWGCVNYHMSLLFSIFCFKIALGVDIGEECDYFAWAEPGGQDPQIQRLKNKASELKQELQKAKRKFALALAVGILGWTMAGLLLYDRLN
ncbi:hypothetical protein Ahy_A02g007185 [Arachis hypogaea]|uniref:GRF-type domain-containing protein n=1 Tax=Arachis hypogaea TaxID=3818 RepID=A0A445ECF5_ARAHY|nr:hypothetical protein Ahy_A02g007185 [Arachis hypogaea]